ncbi:MAG: VOC family protein [bacterium]|nr:VOC family protein [bacterium]
MNKVVHFEVPFDDEIRASKFYKDVFDWELQPMPKMNYVIARSGPTDENYMPKESGFINGGMYKRDPKMSSSPVLVINVESIDDHLKKIEEAGGSVTMPKTQISDMGLYAQIKDTEENIIGVWEDLKK